MSKIIEAAQEAAAIANGEQPVARITIHGHTYVSLADHVALREGLSAVIDGLRRDCAELYQVIGTMAEHCPDPSDQAIVKALDNASAAAAGEPRPHDDLLPFVLPEASR